jgi:hypothetical protein
VVAGLSKLTAFAARTYAVEKLVRMFWRGV